MNVYRLLLVGLLLVVGGLYYFLKQSEKTAFYLQNRIDSEVISLKTKNVDLMQREEWELDLNYSSLDSLPVEVLGPQGCLILRLNTATCYTCYYDIIDSLKNIVSLSGLPLVVLGSFSNTPSFQEKISLLKLNDFPGLNFSSDEKLYVEHLDAPFLCWYYPEGYVSDVFILPKDRPDLLKKYFQTIERKLLFLFGS